MFEGEPRELARVLLHVLSNSFVADIQFRRDWFGMVAKLVRFELLLLFVVYFFFVVNEDGRRSVDATKQFELFNVNKKKRRRCKKHRRVVEISQSRRTFNESGILRGLEQFDAVRLSLGKTAV